MLKTKSTCGISYLRTTRPQFLAVALLLSAPVQLSCFNLAAQRKGNPCVAYSHNPLRWLGDSGHGEKVPGSWHSQAAKPALGKCWHPQSSLVTNSSPSCTNFSMTGPAQPRSSSGSPAIAGLTLGYSTSQKFPRTAALARPRQSWRRFHSTELSSGHSS